jgi:predicted house-cleaning noncanonical NTP pyrophosphatase (MazG superfamily)
VYKQKKIGKTMRKLIIFIAFLIGQVAFAQVKFTASAKTKVAQNERFHLVFSINAQGDHFKAPKIKDFQIQGFSPSTSSSWINGVTTYKKAYTYTLIPKRQGTFTIPPASITYQGKQFFTKPLKITVTKPKKQANTQRQQQQQQQYQDPWAAFFGNRNKHRPGIQEQPKPQTPEEKAALIAHAKDEIFVAALVSNSNPYLNEAVTVTYRLYVSEAGVSDYGIKELPEFDGFWSQDIKGQYRIQKTAIEGKQYRYATLKKVLLFPQRTGKLKIEPLKVEMAVDIPTNQRDIFGRPFTKRELISKQSRTKTVQVKPLPEDNKPIDFSGAVGDFNFNARLNKNQIKTGESAELLLKVQGTGNLKLFSLPEIKLSSELEVYDPEHQEKMRATANGLQGFVSEKYVLVPEYGGKFPIQNLSFTYFDPKQKKYIRKEVANTALDVIGTKKEVAIPSASENTKNVVFNPIKTSLTTVSKTTKLFFKTQTYWILLLISFAIIPILLLFKQRRDAYLNDVEGLKTRKASRLVKKYLSEARKNKNNKEAFYEALEKAYHNFLKAKLKMETSDFSQDKIAELLAEKGVDKNLITPFIDSLKSCDMARYSPFTSVDIANEYDNAAQIITQLNKIL